MLWFGEQFGSGPLRPDPVLPSARFLNASQYSASPAQINAITGVLCDLMQVDRTGIRLEIFDGSEAKALAGKKSGRSREVGHFRVEGGQAIIALDRSECDDRAVLTAIAVHELCHLRLQGEGRVRSGQSDGERLTDLLTVYFGFGVFSANAAMRFARADRNWAAVSRGELDDRTLNAARRDGYKRLGYLRSAEFGYALSCYSWLRAEPKPKWARYVTPGPRAYMEQGLAYLGRASKAGTLPAERTLGQTFTVSGMTIRVTHDNPGPGSLRYLLTDIAARPGPGKR